MAPTVCLSELPTTRSTVNNPYSRRRQRVQNGGVSKHRRTESRHVVGIEAGIEAPLTPPESPRWEAEEPYDLSAPAIVSSTSPNDSSSAKVPAEIDEQWKVLLARREGLLAIVVRTMALVRRNHILQQKVNALRAETRNFIRSVLNNPENRHRQERLAGTVHRKDSAVSSSSERIVDSRPPVLPPSSNTTSFLPSVTSTCCDSDWDDEYEDTSSDESQASSCSV